MNTYSNQLHASRTISKHTQQTEALEQRESLLHFMESYLERCHRSEGYKTMYRSVAAHIEGFCMANNIDELYSNNLTEAFGEEFIYEGRR